VRIFGIILVLLGTLVCLVAEVVSFGAGMESSFERGELEGLSGFAMAIAAIGIVGAGAVIPWNLPSN
jgi:hypothetical protein